VTIRHVHDERTLEDARHHFLLQSSDGSLIHQFLGVDAEWKTILTRKKIKHDDDEGEGENNCSDDPEADEAAQGDDVDISAIKSGGSDGGASVLQVCHNELNQLFLSDCNI
jgi:hypothetical protein